MKHNTMKLTVGFFVIALFYTLFISLFLLFKEKGFFEKRYTYHFQTVSADFFHVGMPLKLSGFKIGVIDDISLEEDASVHVVLSVKESNKKWLSEGSILIVIKPLLGSPHIELFTSLDSPPLKDGATVNIIQSDSINDLIMKVKPIINKALNILDSVDKITTYLASEDSELKKILENLSKLTAKLANDDSLLTSITGDEKVATDIADSINQTKNILRDIKQITQDMSKITSALEAKIIDPSSSSIQEVNAIMKDVKQKLEALDSTVKTVGSYDKELLELKEQISVGISKSNQIIDKVDAFMSDDSASEVMLP